MIVDDFNDFSEFSKEEEITSLLDKNVETSYAEQIAKAKSGNVATYVDIVLEKKMLQHLMTDDWNHHEIECAPTSVFDDPIRKEPSSRIRKNHPSELIIVILVIG